MDSEQRGIEAQRFLDSGVFAEWLTGAETQIVDAFATCPMRDDEGRRLLQFHLKCIREIEATLRGYAQTGRYVAQQEPPVIKRFARKLGL